MQMPLAKINQSKQIPRYQILTRSLAETLSQKTILRDIRGIKPQIMLCCVVVLRKETYPSQRN